MCFLERTKRCTTCPGLKPLSSFSKHPKTPDLRSVNCKACDSKRHKKARIINPLLFKEKNKDYYQKSRTARKAVSSKYYEDNKSHVLDRIKKHRLDNIEKYKLKDKVYAENNKEAVLARSSAYHHKNKEIVLPKLREYYRKNRPLFYAAVNKRKCDKLKRTPKWADLEAIKKIYIGCPPGMVVDHVVPLRGKNVSGFHVHYNLQYLTRHENAKKYNKF